MNILKVLIGSRKLPRTYATWNPSDVMSGVTLSNGNLTLTTGALASVGSGRATLSKSTGKWYWEIHCDTVGTASVAAGLSTQDANLYNAPGFNADALSWGWISSSGMVVKANANTGTMISYTTGDTLGVAYDADAGQVHWYKNNTSIGTTTVTGGLCPAAGTRGNASYVYTANFGASAFAYSPPSGYNAGLYE